MSLSNGYIDLCRALVEGREPWPTPPDQSICGLRFNGMVPVGQLGANSNRPSYFYRLGRWMQVEITGIMEIIASARASAEALRAEWSARRLYTRAGMLF